MKTVWRLIIGLTVVGCGLFAFPSYGQVGQWFTQSFSAGTQADTMKDVLTYFCREHSPYDKCGSYQYEIDQAKIRANQLLGLLASYPSGQQEQMLENLALRVQSAFYTASDINTKVVMAWYYSYLTEQSKQFITSQNLFSLLSDNGNTLRDARVNNTVRPTTQSRNSLDRYRTTPTRGYDPYRSGNTYSPYRDSYDSWSDSQYRNTQDSWRYQSNRGTIDNVWSLGSNVKVDGAREYIDLQGRNVGLDVGVKARVGGRNATVRDGYRVVATVDGHYKTYAGSYRSRNGSWEFDIPQSVMRNARYVEFALICEYCDTGKRFQGAGYNSWDLIDEVRYDVRPGLQQRPSRSVGLGMSDLDRQYDRYRDQLFVDMTTTIQNYGYETIDFAGVEYEIYIDGRKLNERDYIIEDEETTCATATTNSRRYTEYRLRRNSTCAFDISIAVDKNRVDNRDRVQVDVSIDGAQRRRNNTNTSDSFSFYVWE